jgi:hypothetical protein
MDWRMLNLLRYLALQVKPEELQDELERRWSRASLPLRFVRRYCMVPLHSRSFRQPLQRSVVYNPGSNSRQREWSTTVLMPIDQNFLEPSGWQVVLWSSMQQVCRLLHLRSCLAFASKQAMLGR